MTFLEVAIGDWVLFESAVLKSFKKILYIGQIKRTKQGKLQAEFLKHHNIHLHVP